MSQRLAEGFPEVTVEVGVDDGIQRGVEVACGGKTGVRKYYDTIIGYHMGILVKSLPMGVLGNNQLQSCATLAMSGFSGDAWLCMTLGSLNLCCW